MRSRTVLFLLLSSLLYICSCTQKGKDLNYLEKAYLKADNDPSDALKLIDSIIDPQNNLNRRQYMRYLVMHTLLKHRNYIDIENDSSIFEAVEYYKKTHDDPEQVALANFYAGTVLRKQKKYDLAMEYYKNSEFFAKKTFNNQLLGLIEFNTGDLLAEQGSYKKALNKYSYAAQFYHKTYEKQAHSFSSMGRMHLFLNNSDSAFFYFNKGLKLAENLKDKTLLRQISESLSVAFEQVKNYKESYKYLRYSLSHNIDTNRLSRYYLNFALGLIRFLLYSWSNTVLTLQFW